MSSAAPDQDTGVLETYRRLKLELAAIVRTLLYMAERRKDEASREQCRSVLARLAEDRFNLAIVGAFSRGKSSLLNALLGAEKLPTGNLPLTSVITTVNYGEKEKVLVQREGWTFPQEIPVNRLVDYVTQTGNPGNEKRVTLAQVQLPSELLRLGVHFIDTPGVASAIAQNTNATRLFLPQIDAAILVTSFESPVTPDESALLREVGEHVHKLFVVVNKLDLATPEARESVLGAVRGAVKAALPDADSEVIAVSARDALEAKQASSPERLQASGLPLLEAALTGFLRRGKARELLLRAAERTALAARRQESSVRISEAARDPRQAAIFYRRLDEAVESIAKDHDAAIHSIRGRLRAGYPRRCEEEIGLWDADSELLLASKSAEWFADRRIEWGAAAFDQFLRRLSTQLFSEWCARHAEKLESIRQDMTKHDVADAEERARRVLAVPSFVLGEKEADHRPLSGVVVDARRLIFRELRIPVAEFQLPWWRQVLPEGSSRNVVARWWSRRTPEFVRTYGTAVCALLEAAVDDWVGAFDRNLADRAERMAASVIALLPPRTPDERRAVDAGVVKLPEIETVMERLQLFTASVRSLGIGQDKVDDSEPGPRRAGLRRPVVVRPCPICRRVERVTWDFIARYQYKLRISEDEQQRHARQAGFCALHTWQYGAIASPQGICASYPALLTRFAKRLRELARDADCVASLEAGALVTLPVGGQCPACRVAASAETFAARQIARSLGERRSDEVVCAVHLRSVLAAGCSLEAARKLLLEEAAGFERVAEDMEGYVLKHDAVRRDLSTNAERNAAATGLSLLAGAQSLAARATE